MTRQARGARIVHRAAGERLDELLAEREAICAQARDDLVKVLMDFTAAHRTWNQTATDTQSLLALAGQANLGARMPGLPPPLDQIQTAVRQFVASGSIPLRPTNELTSVAVPDPAALAGPATRRLFGGSRAA